MGASKDDPEKTECLIPPDPRDEDIFDVVRGDGPWQRWVTFYILLYAIPACMQNLSITFFAPNVDYWCARPVDSNWTIEQWKHIGLPKSDTKCSRYKIWPTQYNSTYNSSMRKERMSCTSWEYDHSTYTSTVVEKWNLVCDHEWYVSLSRSVFTLGFMFTVLTSGFLSDRYGRKPIIIIYTIIGLVAGVACAFSTSFLEFAVWRFFIAMGTIAAETVAFVLRMEIVGTESRSFFGTVGAYAFVAGHMLLLLIAWSIRDWFWIQIIITAPSVLLLCSWWLIPESPRWLLANRKVDKAMRLLKKIGKMNKVDMEKQEIKLRELVYVASKKNAQAGKDNASILQLFQEPRMRKQIFILYYIWFVVTFVFWGITYNTNDFAGDPFVNFAAYGLIEVPAIILTLVVIKRKGRKYPLAVSYLAGGGACLMAYVVPKGCVWMSTTILLAGKFFVGAAFTIVYIFTVELLPTVLRNTGLGSASTVARIGNILAPFVRELGNATHPVVPQLLYGVLAVTAGLLVLLLPETNHSNMPDTLEEANEISRAQQPKKYRT